MPATLSIGEVLQRHWHLDLAKLLTKEMYQLKRKANEFREFGECVTLWRISQERRKPRHSTVHVGGVYRSVRGDEERGQGGEDQPARHL